MEIVLHFSSSSPSIHFASVLPKKKIPSRSLKSLISPPWIRRPSLLLCQSFKYHFHPLSASTYSTVLRSSSEVVQEKKSPSQPPPWQGGDVLGHASHAVVSMEIVPHSKNEVLSSSSWDDMKYPFVLLIKVIIIKKGKWDLVCKKKKKKRGLQMGMPFCIRLQYLLWFQMNLMPSWTSYWALIWKTLVQHLKETESIKISCQSSN